MNYHAASSVVSKIELNFPRFGGQLPCLYVLLLEFLGTNVPKIAVSLSGIVKRFKVFEYITLCFRACPVNLSMNSFFSDASRCLGGKCSASSFYDIYAGIDLSESIAHLNY
jgi:hypothetical protein